MATSSDGVMTLAVMWTTLVMREQMQKCSPHCHYLDE